MSTEATGESTNVDASSTPASDGKSTATDQQQTTTTADAQASKPADKGQNSDAERIAKGQLADLQKERRARQDFERKYNEQQAQLAHYQRQVQALAGVNPTNPADAETEAIKAQFFKVFPDFQKFDGKVDKILSAFDRMGSIEALEQHVWGKHGLQMIESVEAEVAKGFGTETLNEQQQDIVRALYRSRAEQDPEFLARHERGDKTLIKDFAKSFLDSVFEPARRSAQASAVASQRPVPNGGQRSIVGAGGKKVNLTNNDEFGAAMAAEFKANGGRFEG